MARIKKDTLELTVRIPADTRVPRRLIKAATDSAQAIIDSQMKFSALSKELAAKGIDISADELARRSSGGAVKSAAAGSGGKRRRTVLTGAQRKEIIAALKGGSTINSQAEKYECSPQTIMTIKKGAGLVKAKKANKRK